MSTFLNLFPSLFSFFLSASQRRLAYTFTVNASAFCAHDIKLYSQKFSKPHSHLKHLRYKSSTSLLLRLAAFRKWCIAPFPIKLCYFAWLHPAWNVSRQCPQFQPHPALSLNSIVPVRVNPPPLDSLPFTKYCCSRFSKDSRIHPCEM